jgi:hypothetical protein
MSWIAGQSPSRRHFLWGSALLYLALALLMFRHVLFQSERIISTAGGDIDRYFFPIRSFIFSQFSQSHRLPMWNPFLFGGMPTVGNFQYAMLYPPNWIHLLLPMTLAINWIVALHIALAGFLTSAWCRSRGVSIAGSLLGGLIFMFCGPLQSRVYAGHLTCICVVAWLPGLMICVDAILDGKHSWRGWLGGSAVAALQLLGGYPQIAYYAMLAVAIDVCIRLIGRQDWRGKVALVAGMYAMGAALAAAQVVPGLAVASESQRSGGIPYSLVTAFSIPPENLLTLIAPQIFGDGVHAEIFSRWSITETSLFISATGLVLVLLTICSRRSRCDLSMALIAAIFLILSLGRYTPLFRLLFHVIPMLDHLRAPARLSFIFGLAASVLAARGFDRLSGIIRWKRFIAIVLSTAVLLSVAALMVHRSGSDGLDGMWGRIISWLASAEESWATNSPNDSPGTIAASAALASRQLLIASLCLAGVAVTLILQRRHSRARYLILIIAIIELWLGSAVLWRSFRPATEFPASWQTAMRDLPDSQRVLITQGMQQNLAAALGIESIGGYDPMVPQRWADMTFPLLGAAPRSGDLMVRRFLPSSRWPLLRLGRLVPEVGEVELPAPMPRVSLIHAYRVMANADDSLQAIRRPDFDPRKIVVLEEPPSPAPAPQSDLPAGTVRCETLSTDALGIAANLTRPAILLVTDAWSPGWRARPIQAPQSSYQVLIADHALRAIPLAAGQHHLILEYRPLSVRVGFAISAIALLGYAVIALVLMRRAKARNAMHRFDCPSRGESAG